MRGRGENGRVNKRRNREREREREIDVRCCADQKREVEGDANGAVAVAQLAEQSFLILEVCGSNPFIGKFYT